MKRGTTAVYSAGFLQRAAFVLIPALGTTPDDLDHLARHSPAIPQPGSADGYGAASGTSFRLST
ncbi:MAG TPA: hypothetical protein VMV63_04585 [Acidithiobacillus sp.]|nr:hypothetical protein [Acidithiobacillus sp.]